MADSFEGLKHFDLHAECVNAGLQIDSHYSDLYVLATPEARELIRKSGFYYTAFTSQIDGKMWYEIPFAFTPFWESKSDVAARTLKKLLP